MAQAMLYIRVSLRLRQGFPMMSLSLLPFFLYVVPAFGMGLAVLVDLLQRMSRSVAAPAARIRSPWPRQKGSRHDDSHPAIAHGQ